MRLEQTMRQAKRKQRKVLSNDEFFKDCLEFLKKHHHLTRLPVKLRDNTRIYFFL